MRFFFDIGGFKGHSSLAALDPLFGFDKVFCFEPDPGLYKRLREKVSDPRFTAFQLALGDHTSQETLWGGGDLGASILEDYPPVKGSTGNKVQVMQASAILRGLATPSDFVRMKFNCEGSELAIIRDLLQHDLAFLLQDALIDFDAARIDHLKLNVEALKVELSRQGIRYLEPSQCQYGMVTNYGGIRNFLIVAGASIKSPPPLPTLAASLFYNMSRANDPELSGYHKMRVLNAIPVLRAISRSKRSRKPT